MQIHIKEPMRIDDIDALLATVQFSSLNQAAEYLGITQSAITALQRLEQELNVTLLERQTRPLTLTAAGHRVYEQCLSIKRETKNTLQPVGSGRRTARCAASRRTAEHQRDRATGGAVGPEPAVSRTVAPGDLRLERPAAASAGKRRAGRHAGDGAAQQNFAEGYSGRLLCPLEVVPIAARRLNLRASSLRECAEQGVDP